MPCAKPENIKIGISACLLGQAVRYDGNHKRSKYCADYLMQLFEFVPICPEHGAGMGVPRPPIRLQETNPRPRAFVIETQADVTAQLLEFAQAQTQVLGTLSGYVFCTRSPSCGVASAKVFRSDGEMSTQFGQGIFAREVIANFPELPVVEDCDLLDALVRENFALNVYVYYNWQVLLKQPPALRLLMDFHSRHKYLIMAYSQVAYRSLGSLLSGRSRYTITTLYREYFAQLTATMKEGIRREGHTNVLMHLQGYFKHLLSKEEKKVLTGMIKQFSQDELNLLSAIQTIKEALIRFPNRYLEQQVYLHFYENYLSIDMD